VHSYCCCCRRMRVLHPSCVSIRQHTSACIHTAAAAGGCSSCIRVRPSFRCAKLLVYAALSY
jgi:hypothetical protein